MGPRPSTRQQLVKVAQVPCLYRHSLNLGYYGIKKVGGKRKEHSLGTTDRKLAERRLKEWLSNLGKIDTEVERLTLQQLIEKQQRMQAGKSAEATEMTLNQWIRLHWDRLRRILTVLVGKTGSVISIFPHELFLPYAQALDYVIKRGQLALGDVVVALKPAPLSAP